jgi:uncharacterized Zn finger protein
MSIGGRKTLITNPRGGVLSGRRGIGRTYRSVYRCVGHFLADERTDRAAEETRPREAIELYQQYAERLIALRERKNYQAACTYLVKGRALYEKLGEGEAWTSYITALRERKCNLRSLREDLAAAGL